MSSKTKFKPNKENKERLERLENKAQKASPELDKNQSPKVYFHHAKAILEKAGGAKKQENIESSFIHLRMYQILIDKLKKHPKISDFRDELKYNQQKSKDLNEEINSLKERILRFDSFTNQGMKLPEFKSDEEKFAFLTKAEEERKKKEAEDSKSPRLKRIEQEKMVPLVKRKNQNFIKSQPGDNFLQNQFYNLDDCIIEM
eukprot:gene1499-12116_t